MRFVDTSFWIALQVPRDRHHQDAAALWEQERGALVTTSLVAGETWTYLNRKAGHRAAIAFRRAALELRTLQIVSIDEGTEDAAWRWLERRNDRAYSFVDATSFVLMRRLRLREALAFDGDFSAAGFVEVRP